MRDLEKPKFHESGNLWEIDIFNDISFNDDSLFWTVASSFLITSLEDEDFDEGIRVLFGEDAYKNENSLGELKILFQKYNPFSNRYSLVFCGTLGKLIGILKDKVTDFTSAPISSSGSDSILSKISEIVRPDAWWNIPGLEIVDFVVWYEDQRYRLRNARLEKQIKNRKVVTLCLLKHSHITLGLEHEKALRYLWEIVGFNADWNILALLKVKNKSFISTFLEQNRKDDLERLYKHTDVLSHLDEAGHIVDPSEKDASGETGFYRAMFHDDDGELLRLLFDYAVGTNEGAFFTRIHNYDSVSQTLNRQIEAFDKSKEKYVTSPDHLNDKNISHKNVVLEAVSKFNRFQREICQTLSNTDQNGFQCQVKDDDRTDDKQTIIKEVQKSWDILNNILGLYHKVHDDLLSTTADDRDDEKFKKYFENRFYLQKVDSNISMTMFQHIRHLRQRLEREDEIFEKTESSLFYFLFCYRYYWQIFHKQDVITADNSHSTAVEMIYRIMIFLEKQELLRKLEDFKKHLEKLADTKKTVRDKVLPDGEINSLESLPDIKDTIEIRRVLHYLKLATSVDLEKEENDVVVIERALQVLGECLASKCQSHKTPSLIDCFLVSSIPPETVEDLTELRQHFSHVNRYNMLSRLVTERNMDLFRGVQKELKEIEIKIKEIKNIQKIHQHKIVTDKALSLLNPSKQVSKSNLLPSVQEREMLQRNVQFPEDIDLTDEDSFFEITLNEKSKYRKYSGNNHLRETQLNIAECTFQKWKKKYSAKGLKLKDALHLEYETCYSGHLNSLEKYLKILEAERSNEDFESISLKIKHVCKCIIRMLMLFKEEISLTKEESEIYAKSIENLKYEESFIMKSSIVKNITVKNIIVKNIIVKNIIKIAKDIDKITKKVLKYSETPGKKNYPCNQFLSVSKLRTELEKYRLTKEREHRLRSANEILIAKPNIPENSPSKGNSMKETEEPFFTEYSSSAECIDKELEEKSTENPWDENVANKKYTILNTLRSSFVKRTAEYFKVETINPYKDEEIYFEYSDGEDSSSEGITKKNFNPNDIKSLWSEDVQTNTTNSSSSEDHSEREVEDDSYDNADLSNHIETLKNCFKGKKRLTSRECEDLCKKLKITCRMKRWLSGFVQDKHPLRDDEYLEFLIDRMSLLEQKLFQYDRDLKSIWLTNNDEIAKKYVKDRIMWRYNQDAKLQAAVELLVFDCMNVLDDKRAGNFRISLDEVNLRNILGHGNVLKETVGKIMNNEDLPLQTVCKALKYVKDKEVVKKIYKIVHFETNKYRNDFENEYLEHDIPRIEWNKYIKNLPLKQE